MTISEVHYFIGGFATLLVPLSALWIMVSIIALAHRPFREIWNNGFWWLLLGFILGAWVVLLAAELLLRLT